MGVTRRRFLAYAAALPCWAGLARAATLTADGFMEIRLGPERLGLLEGGAGRTEAWLIGPGPEPLVIRARQGEQLKLRFINDLGREVWLHFYGVRGPSDLMTLNILPGADEAVDCVFTPPDAGTFWIAPMADQSRMRDMGLTAVLVVEEKEPLPLDDLVLVLDDWKLGEDGAIEANFGDIEAMVGEGRLGNWFTINNRFRPRLPLGRKRYTRLRIVNAANVRTMNLLFKGYDPLLIARDGQPVKPTLLNGKALSLAPGQRADLVVSAEEGDIRLALDLFEDVVEIGYLIPAKKEGETAPALAENFALPPNPAVPPQIAADAPGVAVTLQGGLKGGLTSAVLNGQERDLRTLLENGKGWAINGVAGPSPQPAFTAKAGDTVKLDITNRTAFPQPLHIHGHVWQAGDQPDSPPLQDTAVIPAGQTVTLAFKADNPGLWALQSLVAERADGGLIASFLVE